MLIRPKHTKLKKVPDFNRTTQNVDTTQAHKVKIGSLILTGQHKMLIRPKHTKG